MTRTFAVSVVLLAILQAAARTQEWTRFLGPNGQAQGDPTADIPTEWTESDYNWRAELPGVGHAAPVIWGDRVFVLSGDPATGTRHVVCLNIVDGRLIWQRDFPATTHHVHVQNSLGSSSPAVDAQRVYVAWGTPDEIALMALTHDGAEAWQLNLGTHDSEHGFGASPIVVDDMVILTNDQDDPQRCALIAVDAATGHLRWTLPRRHTGGRQNACYSTPCILETDAGRELIVLSWAHGVSSHDLRTGAVNWELPVFKLRTVSSPVLAAGLIIGSCGAGNGNNTVVAVRPGNKDGRRPEIAYTIDKTSAPYVPTICAADEILILWGDRGIVSCIDAATGKLHWRERVGGNYFGSPVRVGDRVYCISTEGDVVVLEASPQFKVLGRNPLGEPSNSTPAVADGRMYLRTQSHLVSIGGK